MLMLCRFAKCRGRCGLPPKRSTGLTSLFSKLGDGWRPGQKPKRSRKSGGRILWRLTSVIKIWVSKSSFFESSQRRNWLATRLQPSAYILFYLWDETKANLLKLVATRGSFSSHMAWVRRLTAIIIHWSRKIWNDKMGGVKTAWSPGSGLFLIKKKLDYAPTGDGS